MTRDMACGWRSGTVLERLVRRLLGLLLLYALAAAFGAILFLLVACVWVHPVWSLLAYTAVLGASALLGLVLDRIAGDE